MGLNGFMAHRNYAMSFLFIAGKEIIMKFVVIRNWDGEITLYHQGNKEKIIKKVLKEIKKILSSKDCEFEIAIDDLVEYSNKHKMYSRWIVESEDKK